MPIRSFPTKARPCRFTIALECWLVLCGLAVPAHPATAEGRSAGTRGINLVVIVADDLARWAVGAYGNSEARTPNIDRLAREGAKFTQAFATTPVCSPSRVSLLTGLYGTQAGITDYLARNEGKQAAGLPQTATTWPRVLQGQGYRTALIGKWHLGELPQFHPTRHGYDYFFGALHGRNQLMDPTLEVDGAPRKLKGPLTDLLTDAAVRFIEEHRDRPFALSVHYNAPHKPYTPVPEADSAPFKHRAFNVPAVPGPDAVRMQRLYRRYYSSVHSLDRNLGRLLERLDRLQLSGHTVVLLSSDHGYNIGHHGLYGKGNAVPLDGRRYAPRTPNLFDTSIAIPLIVRWPGSVKAGTEVNRLVSNHDIFPSVLGLLGIPPPNDPAPVRTGLDFSPWLRGGASPAWRDAVFGQYDLVHGRAERLRMVREERYKLIRHPDSGRGDELYDLADDPGETRNHADDPAYRDIRVRLERRLAGFMRAIDDPALRTGTPDRGAAQASDSLRLIPDQVFRNQPQRPGD